MKESSLWGTHLVYGVPIFSDNLATALSNEGFTVTQRLLKQVSGNEKTQGIRENPISEKLKDGKL